MSIVLDAERIRAWRAAIEEAVVPAMEAVYLAADGPPGDDFRPGLKPIEKIVSFYDYWACGISVLAVLGARGDARALALMERIRANCDYYHTEIYGHDTPGRPGKWTVPLRRLIFHLALAYERLAPVLGEEKTAWCRELIEQQVPVVVEHNKDFLPGERDLHLTFANNHTAIFMQGVWHSGRVLGRTDWQELAREFAERFYASGHPDGYFEENTNEAREGGPSLVYTPLTAGCLFDVLGGRARADQEKFLRAGSFFRSLLNSDFHRIPLADERTNGTGRAGSYGLALHSLSAAGRGFVVDRMEALDFGRQTPESLAVLHHELDLMSEGDCAPSENLLDGSFRLTLPLGVLRRGGFTAGISALRALNREIRPDSDYALDRQTLVYLSHRDAGVVLSGVKSKRDPGFSTFRVGEDAYPVRTGELRISEDGAWAEAAAHYAGFDGLIRWDLGETARLTLRVGGGHEVRTALPIGGDPRIRTDATWRIEERPGFSPYTQGNTTDPVKLLVADWRDRLVLEFEGAAPR